MAVHAPTLLYILSAIALSACCVMLREWSGRQERAPEFLWWAAGFLCFSIAAAFATLRMFHWDGLAVGAANALAIAGHLLVRRGTLKFCGKMQSNVWYLAVPAWLSAFFLTPLLDTVEVRVLFVSVFTSLVVFANASDLWRARRTARSAGQLSMLYLLHGAFCTARAATIWSEGAIVDASTFSGLTFNVTYFENVVFSIIVTHLLVSMTRERSFERVRAMSETDYLTGIDNRRAFTTKSETVLSRGMQGHRTATLLLFDLDHFKRINDRHGHAVGDDVLRTFCRVVEEHLKPGDLFGRLGGEEFAALLPGLDAQAGERRASAIAQSFAVRAHILDGRDIAATVSVGLSTTAETFTDVACLLTAADGALYRAKQSGRNRVERARRTPLLIGGEIVPAE